MNSFALVVLVCVSLSFGSTALAQDAATKQLDLAINGFELDEAAAQKALASGGNINWKNDAMGGETMLVTAIKGYKDARVIQFLINHGADPKIADKTGKNAIDWATQYKIGKDNNGREIMKLLGSAPQPAAGAQNKTTPAPSIAETKTVPGGPSIQQLKASLEKSLSSAYENHFFGIKNKVAFEWAGGVVIGQQETRLRPAQKCYPAKVDVRVTITDPRDGNTSTLTRGVNAEIGGYRKAEIFCFFKNGFGEWDSGTYEP